MIRPSVCERMEQPHERARLRVPCFNFAGLSQAAMRALEGEIVRRAQMRVRTITTAPIRGRTPWGMAANTALIATGAAQARGILADFRPEVLLSTGGYASFPAALAARSRGIPLALYLPDMHPGWAVRAIAGFLVVYMLGAFGVPTLVPS